MKKNDNLMGTLIQAYLSLHSCYEKKKTKAGENDFKMCANSKK